MDTSKQWYNIFVDYTKQKPKKMDGKRKIVLPDKGKEEEIEKKLEKLKPQLEGKNCFEYIKFLLKNIKEENKLDYLTQVENILKQWLYHCFF